MGCRIERVAEKTFCMEDSGVRFFLLEGSESALLIDSGMTVRALDIVRGLTELPVALLNTHADRDHVGSNEQFASFYMHPLEEEQYRSQGGKGQILPVTDGDVLDLGGRKLQILHVPGHTPGSIAVLDRTSRILISGDPVQQNGRIFMFGPKRSMQLYIAGLMRLENQSDEFDELWPSHADLPIGPEFITACRKGAQRILEGQVRGCPGEVHGHACTVYDLGFTVFLCDA